MGIKQELKKINKIRISKSQKYIDKEKSLKRIIEEKYSKKVGMEIYKKAYEITNSQDRKLQTEYIIKLKSVIKY